MAEIPEKNINELIQEILKNGSIIFGDHARERMSERNYTFADVKYILKNGSLKEETIYKGQTRYTFCGNDLDDDPGEVIIELRESTNKIIIITVQ